MAEQENDVPAKSEAGGGGESSSLKEGRRDLAFLEKGGFEIVKITEKHGQFRKAVPTMPLPLAIICCVLNMILPGIGTLVSAFTVFNCPTEYEQASEAFVNNLLAAFLQILTLIILVGYIWSVMWGVIFVSLALGKRAQDKEAASLPEPTKV